MVQHSTFNSFCVISLLFQGNKFRPELYSKNELDITDISIPIQSVTCYKRNGGAALGVSSLFAAAKQSRM